MIDFSIRNPLIVNLLLAVIVVSGVLSWKMMPQEMFPTVETDRVRIKTVYEGASPIEIEQQITLPIEEAFDGMLDIDTISSSSAEGVSSVLVELKSGADVDDFMREARTALDQITDIPDEAEEPELVRLKTRFPVISVSLYGDVSRGYLYDLAEDVKRQLSKRQ